jgi:hypothetical protein
VSAHDYRVSLGISVQGYSFDSLVFAALRQADTVNAAKIRAAWPELSAEMQERYSAPGGLLPGEPGHDAVMRARWNRPAATDAAEESL